VCPEKNWKLQNWAGTQKLRTQITLHDGILLYYDTDRLIMYILVCANHPVMYFYVYYCILIQIDFILMNYMYICPYIYHGYMMLSTCMHVPIDYFKS